MTARELIKEMLAGNIDLDEEIRVFWFTPENKSIWLDVNSARVYHNSNEHSVVLRTSLSKRK